MSKDEIHYKIKIQGNGPYIVSGGVPLSEKLIVHKNKGNEYMDGREYPLEEEYALCRCGLTKTPPFCDGSHKRTGFRVTETASMADYADRAEILYGPDLVLTDDNRCAFARFCQRRDGDVWELTRNSNDAYLKSEAIIAAVRCPTGRLVEHERDGTPIEPHYEPAIEILQDIEKGVSGPIFVKGYIPMESADGVLYEKRNRMALCRCGRSENMPFCDATHVTIGYKDKK